VSLSTNNSVRMKSFLLSLIAACLLLSCNRPAGDQKRPSGTEGGTASARVEPAQMTAWFSGLLRPLGPMRASAFGAVSRETDLRKADSLVARFRVSYSNALEAIGDSLAAGDDFGTWLREDPGARAVADSILAPLGCVLLESEGMGTPASHSGDIVRNVGSRLSPAFVKFLTMRGEEEKEGFSDDAALVIPWNALSDRIAAWEKFITGNPGFLLRSEAESWYEIYLRTYLTGTDNSRIFTFDGDTLDTDVRASYERFVRRYSSTKSAFLVRGYLELLGREGYRNSQAAEEYLRAQDIRTMLAVQPPLR
jgi:hypothetical protein